jgi:WhiB family redox-sensing transcriptional regulator
VVLIGPSTDWRDQAACLGSGTDMFPDPAEPGYADGVAMARALCALCPVTADCLGWARAEGIDRGVWGGVNLDEVDGPVRRPCPSCLDEGAPPREVYCKGVCRRHYQRNHAPAGK